MISSLPEQGRRDMCGVFGIFDPADIFGRWTKNLCKHVKQSEAGLKTRNKAEISHVSKSQQLPLTNSTTEGYRRGRLSAYSSYHRVSANWLVSSRCKSGPNLQISPGSTLSDIARLCSRGSAYIRVFQGSTDAGVFEDFMKDLLTVTRCGNPLE
jgi:hypothetical protein